MNDWNGNGHYDAGDSYSDYHMANSSHSGGSGSWMFVLLAIIMVVCPPLGAIIVFGIIIFGKCFKM